MAHKATARTARRTLLSTESAELVAKLHGADVSAVRLRSDDPDGGIHISAVREEGFCLLFQRRFHPAHDFWKEGRLVRMDAAPAGTIGVVDLSVEPAARLVEPVDTLMFHLPRAALDAIATDASASRIEAICTPEGPAADRVVQQLQGLIIEGLNQPHASRSLLHEHVLLGLGVHFAETYGGMRPRSEKRGGLAPHHERRAKELIAADLAKSAPLSDIALECGLSTAHFSRAFKASTGTTPHGFLQACRVAHARDLLLAGETGLADIALRCGFADQSHFTRVFTRFEGVGPGAWRRLRGG